MEGGLLRTHVVIVRLPVARMHKVESPLEEVLVQLAAPLASNLLQTHDRPGRDLRSPPCRRSLPAGGAAAGATRSSQSSSGTRTSASSCFRIRSRRTGAARFSGLQWQKRSAGASVEHRMLYDATRTVAAMGMPYIEFVRGRSERGRRRDVGARVPRGRAASDHAHGGLCASAGPRGLLRARGVGAHVLLARAIQVRVRGPPATALWRAVCTSTYRWTVCAGACIDARVATQGRL